MFTRIIFTVFFITFLICCNKAVPEHLLKTNICSVELSDNEVEVTSLVASDLLKKGLPEGKTATIVTTSLINHSQKGITEILKASTENPLNIETTMIEDFESKNRVPLSFGDDVLILPYKYESISLTEFTEISKINPYTEKLDLLQKRFPNSAGVTGVVGFSRIGFNKDFSKAIIYAFRWYEHSSFFLLEKENCEWRIKKEQMVWLH